MKYLTRTMSKRMAVCAILLGLTLACEQEGGNARGFFEENFGWIGSGLSEGGATKATDYALLRTRLEQLRSGESPADDTQSQEEKTISVWLTLDTPFDSAELSSRARETMNAGIASTQQAVLDNLRRSGAVIDRNLVERLKFTPGMLIRGVDQYMLDVLRNDESVLRLKEDPKLEFSLWESIPLIRAHEAWNLGFRGHGSAVVILDTGVDASHSHFQGRVIHEACFSKTVPGEAGTCLNGQDTHVGPAAATPPDGGNRKHGTHVAGIVASNLNPSTPNGIWFDSGGVANKSDIIAINVSIRKDGDLKPSFAAALKALEHVYENRHRFNIAAVNMSFGGGEHGSECDGALINSQAQLLQNAGIAVIASAGNDGFRYHIEFPACEPAVWSVGASDFDDEVWDDSNRANFLDFVAPGVNIRSTEVGGGTIVYSGTSMAAPHVAGVVALMHARYPKATTKELYELISAGADKIWDGDSNRHYDRINAIRSFKNMMDDRQVTMRSYKGELYQTYRGFGNRVHTRHSTDNSTYGIVWEPWQVDTGVDIYPLGNIAMHVNIATNELFQVIVNARDKKPLYRTTTDGDTWTAWQSLPLSKIDSNRTAVGDPELAYFKGQLYAFFTEAQDGWIIVSSYDSIGNKWTFRQALNLAIEGDPEAEVVLGGQQLIVGGALKDTVLDLVFYEKTSDGNLWIKEQVQNAVAHREVEFESVSNGFNTSEKVCMIASTGPVIATPWTQPGTFNWSGYNQSGTSLSTYGLIQMEEMQEYGSSGTATILLQAMRHDQTGEVFMRRSHDKVNFSIWEPAPGRTSGEIELEEYEPRQGETRMYQSMLGHLDDISTVFTRSTNNGKDWTDWSKD